MWSFNLRWVMVVVMADPDLLEVEIVIGFVWTCPFCGEVRGDRAFIVPDDGVDPAKGGDMQTPHAVLCEKCLSCYSTKLNRCNPR